MKNKATKRSLIKTILLIFSMFIVTLICTCALNKAWGALSYYDPNYNPQVAKDGPGISLFTEQDEESVLISGRDYEDGEWNTTECEGIMFPNVPDTIDNLGTLYDANLYVENTGTIDIMTRVTLYSYSRGNGSYEHKVTWHDLDTTTMIKMSETLEGSGWGFDTYAKDNQRMVLYYLHDLKPGEKAVLPIEAIKVLEDIAVSHIESVDDLNIITYDYDGGESWWEIQADAVQTHSAEDHAWSAWGRKITVESGESHLLITKIGDDDVTAYLDPSRL